MRKILKNFSSPALIMAIEANQFELWRILAQMLQVELQHEPEKPYLVMHDRLALLSAENRYEPLWKSW
jgi:hypothetical protein